VPDAGAGGVPSTAGVNVAPGWYSVNRETNSQAYWDGEAWTKTRRWRGVGWIEDSEPPYEPTVNIAAGAPPPPRSSVPSEALPVGRAPYYPPTGSRSMYGGPPPVPTTNGLAVASLVLSVLTLFGIGSLLGIIFGVRARRQIRESRGYQSGDGLALAGIIVGLVTLVVAAIAIALWISLLTVVHSAIIATNTTGQCEGEVRSVEIAVTAYHAQTGKFPTPPAPWSAATYASNYEPLTSATNSGPFLNVAPSPNNYVIEYDSSGNVWVAPPGQYGATFEPGQGFDTNPSACQDATGS
jgi:hypothetical protein